MELKARLTATKASVQEAREELRAAERRGHALRARNTVLQERIRRGARSRLGADVLESLLPARAAQQRDTPPSEGAKLRERAHLVASPSYAAAVRALTVEDADRVDIAGLAWWVPRDRRSPGRIADRLMSGRQLPLHDILRTREIVANGVMLDIGANIGLTSVTRAILGDFDVVYAAEPEPHNFACLVRTVVENGLQGCVMPDQVAISDRDGTAHLHVSRSIGGHSLDDRGRGIDVATRTVDAWMRQLGVARDAVQYVKVDTQGREGHVLDGAAGLLSRTGVVWEIEFSPKHLTNAGSGPEGLIERMCAAFTHFIDLTPDAPGVRLRPITELAGALGYLGPSHSYTNLLVYRV